MLRYIKVSSFPGVPEGTYDLGVLNKIHGQNGCGKSSLFRAALWCLTSLMPDGSEAGNAYGETTVEVGITTGDVVWRQRKSKREGVAVNGNPAPEWRVPGLSSRAFACMLFPMAFFGLSEAYQREIFLSLTPDIDPEEMIAARVAGFKAGTFPKGFDIKKTYDSYVQMRRALEKEVIAMRATLVERSNAPISPLSETTGEDIQELQEQLKKSEEKLLDARVCARRWDEYQAALLVYNQAQSAHRAWVNKMSMDNKDNSDSLKSPEAMDAELNAARDALDSAARSVTELAAVGEALKSQLSRLSISPTCSQCGQPLPVHAREKIEAEHTAVAEQREALVAQYKVAVAQKKKAEDAFLGQQKTYAKWRTEYARRPQEPQVPAAPTEPPSPIGSLAEIQTERDSLLQRIAVAQSSQRNRQKQLEAERSRVDGIAKLTRELETSQQRLTYLEALEEALHPVRGVESEILRKKTAQIQLPGFEFSFTETLANGNVKEKFSVKRADGTTLSQLSTGEKVKFGLALSELIANLSQTPIRTVFVETADVVDRIRLIPGMQMSIERVNKEQLTLSVEVVKPFAENAK